MLPISGFWAVLTVGVSASRRNIEAPVFFPSCPDTEGLDHMRLAAQRLHVRIVMESHKVQYNVLY